LSNAKFRPREGRPPLRLSRPAPHALPRTPLIPDGAGARSSEPFPHHPVGRSQIERRVKRVAEKLGIELDREQLDELVTTEILEEQFDLPSQRRRRS
jgi:hypothetical protein